jgi:hypothetical protein
MPTGSPEIAVVWVPIPDFRVPHFAKCGPGHLTAHQPEQHAPQDTRPIASDLDAILYKVYPTRWAIRCGPLL